MSAGVFAAAMMGQGAGGDPLWASVALLLHMDDGFNDFSDYARVPTVFSGASISTVSPKFGLGSGAFNASSSGYVTFPASADWNSANRTIEGWVYRTANSRLEYLISNRQGGSLSDNWVVECSAAGALALVRWRSGTVVGYVASSVSLAINTWTHFRIVIEGLNQYIFINGVRTGFTTASAQPDVNMSQTLVIGRSMGETNRNWTGKIDDLRITLASRGTSDFTPPDAPFPNG